MTVDLPANIEHPVTTKKTTKHRITQPSHSIITGVLEQIDLEQPTQGRRIALLLHGSLGHKDYLFLKHLALRLPIDSFRFDFRGNFESPGPWRTGALNEDVEDIVAVVDYLSSKFGYVVDLVVGHSRGVVAGLRWMCTAKEASTRIWDKLKEHQRHELDTKGYFERHETVARQPFVCRVTKDDLEEFSNFDTSLVWNEFPQSTDVLSMHGLSDETVPSYDAIIYAQALGARSPGTHNLCLVEDADHNFTGFKGHVTATILEWFGTVQTKTVRTGVWGTGVRYPDPETKGSSKL